MYEQITYEVEDPVATITLNRPAQLNAWTQRMAAEVRHAVATAEDDEAVVGIVITGAGRAFCSGADFKSLEQIRAGDVNLAETFPPELSVSDRPAPPDDYSGEYTYLLAVDKPVIAAINGPIAGMAIPIALCCDLRFMAAEAPLVTAFSQRGLIGEWGVAWLLPRLVGTGHALDLLFSSRRVSGAECAAMGLVNRALPADEVLPHAQQYVRDLAGRCSPYSLSMIKKQVYAQLSEALGPAERTSRRQMVDSFRSADFKEGVSAFLAKRTPRYGRLGRS